MDVALHPCSYIEIEKQEPGMRYRLDQYNRRGYKTLFPLFSHVCTRFSEHKYSSELLAAVNSRKLHAGLEKMKAGWMWLFMGKKDDPSCTVNYTAL